MPAPLHTDYVSRKYTQQPFDCCTAHIPLCFSYYIADNFKNQGYINLDCHMI